MPTRLPRTPRTPYTDAEPPGAPAEHVTPTTSNASTTPATPRKPAARTSVSPALAFSPIVSPTGIAPANPQPTQAPRTNDPVAATLDEPFGEAAYDHVFVHVLNYGTESALYRTLHAIGFKDIHDLVMMNDQDIQNLASPQEAFGVTDPNKLAAMESIHLPACKKLRQFISWYYHIKIRYPNTFATLSDYTNLTRRQFDEYRSSGYCPRDGPIQTTPELKPPPTPQSTPPSPYTKVHNPVTDFQKTVKKDVTQFPELKDDKGWDEWNRKTLVLARSQGFENVFDHTYTPKSPNDQELFLQHQRFMTAVFITKPQTVEGKAIVICPWKKSDAQVIYAELVDYYTSSVKAKLKSDDIRTYITTDKLGPSSSWRDTTENFIKYRKDQVRILHDLTPDTEHYPDTALKKMLEVAVQPIKPLHAV